jgi:hypothetical protein
MSTTHTAEDHDVQQLGSKLENARQLFERQHERLADLRHEADEAGLARDKALYWLLRLCDAAEREQWPLSADAQEALEEAKNVLFDNNIYTGLPEPDAAILRLMEIVMRDQEGHEYVDR